MFNNIPGTRRALDEGELVSTTYYYYYYYSNTSIILQDIVFTAYFYDVEAATPKMQVYFKNNSRNASVFQKIVKVQDQILTVLA